MDRVTIILEMEKARSSFNVSFIKTTHKIYAYSAYPRNLEKSTDLFWIWTCCKSDISTRSKNVRNLTAFYILTRKIRSSTLNSYGEWKFWPWHCTASQYSKLLHDPAQDSGWHSHQLCREAFHHSRTNESQTFTLNSLIQARQFLTVFHSAGMNLCYLTSCLKQHRCDLIHILHARLRGQELFEPAGKLRWQRWR